MKQVSHKSRQIANLREAVPVKANYNFMIAYSELGFSFSFNTNYGFRTGFMATYFFSLVYVIIWYNRINFAFIFYIIHNEEC